MVQRRIPTKEAVQALPTLRLYEEQQDDGDSGLISRLGRHERAIRQRTEQRLKQSTSGIVPHTFGTEGTSVPKVCGTISYFT